MAGEAQVNREIPDEWAWHAVENPLPSSVEVVIIGGGIVGCSAAYFLAREGLRVAVFEKGRIAGEQSGRNWGWVRQQGRSPVELPLMMRSLQLWLELREELGEHRLQAGWIALPRRGRRATRGAGAVVERRARARTRYTMLLDAQELAGVLKCPMVGAGRSDAHRERCASRTQPCDAGDRPRSPAARRADRQSLCGSRHRSRRGSRSGCDYRARARRGIDGRLCRRCLDALLLPIDGHHLPAIDCPRHGCAHRAGGCEMLEGEAWSPSIAIRRRADGGYTVAHGGSFLHSLTPDTLAVRAQVLAGLAAGSRVDPRSRWGASSSAALRTPIDWASR